MGLALLEGERVHRVVRAHPLARLADYGPALALLALAGLLGAFFSTSTGQGLSTFLDANTGPLAVPLLLVVWWLGLGLCTVPFSLHKGRPWPAAYGVLVAIAGGILAIVLTSATPSARDAAGLVPWMTLAAVPAPLAIAELLRRTPTWVLTDLRLVQRDGILDVREQSWRLPRVERAAMHPRGPKSLDLGDLTLAGKDGEAHLRGVRPLKRLRDEVELLLHTSPEAPYLADQRDTAEKVARLLRPGDAPPR